MDIHSKSSIGEQLLDTSHQFAVYVKLQDDHLFLAKPDNKWSSGEQLDHLTKSIKLVNKALHLPKFMFKYMFKKDESRENRSYEELLELYNDSLSEKTNYTYDKTSPKNIKLENKMKMLKEFMMEYKKLNAKQQSLSDDFLDDWRLPHPSMGSLSIREMLKFTIFHTKHHFDSIKEVETLV